TAVKGLGGKGIIDVLISVKKKNIAKNKKRLEKEGYVFHASGSGKERIYFDREYVYNGKARRVHLHLNPHGGFELRRAIAFVKYLTAHPDKMKEYAKIKREGAEYAKGEAQKYRDYKQKFLEKLGKEALREFKKTSIKSTFKKL
ncbi:MAG: GrpB family protein, partial [Nanoarchaeota archaeon]